MRLTTACVLGLMLILGMMAAIGCHSADKDRDQNSVANEAANGRTASITGEVTLQGQEDASGTQVYVPGTSLVSITDSNGRFTLAGVGAGSYEVMAKADGYEPASVGQVVVIPSSKMQYALAPIALTRRVQATAAKRNANGDEWGAIKGQVTLAGTAQAGAAVADWARCTITLEKTSYRTLCAADGSFLLWNLPPDQYSLLAELDGFEPARVNVRVLPGPEPTTLQVPMTPSAAVNTRQIRGLVEMIGPDGTPTKEFQKVTVQALGRPGLVARVANDGTFAMPNLAPTRYQITATADGYTSAPAVEVDLTSLPETEIQLTLNAAQSTTSTVARVRGVAMKNVEDENDMSGIMVALAGTNLMVTTDEVGQYVFNNVPPGSYKILAQAQGFRSAEQGPLEVQGGADVEAEGMLLDPIRDYPEVLATTPGDGTRNVVIKREIPIMIRFSKKMDPASLRQAIRLDPEVSFRVFLGKEQPDTEDDLAKVVLSGAVSEPIAKFRTRYTLTIGEEAKDLEGLNLQEPFRMSFTTGEPSVIGTTPQNRGVLDKLDPSAPVEVYFNATMEPRTLSAETLRIRPVPLSSPNLTTQEDPETGWTKLIISATWQQDTNYRISVLRRARTTGRNSLSNTPYTFGFRTVKLTPYITPNQPEVPSP